MRTNYNRRTRRAALCMTAPRPRSAEPALPTRRVALAAADDLADVAARIAEELELSPELAELMAQTPRRR